MSAQCGNIVEEYPLSKVTTEKCTVLPLSKVTTEKCTILPLSKVTTEKCTVLPLSNDTTEKCAVLPLCDDTTELSDILPLHYDTSELRDNIFKEETARELRDSLEQVECNEVEINDLQVLFDKNIESESYSESSERDEVEKMNKVYCLFTVQEKFKERGVTQSECPF